MVSSGEAIDRFLSHLVPSSMNIYFSSQTHALASTPCREVWYGAQYGKQPMDPVSFTLLWALRRSVIMTMWCLHGDVFLPMDLHPHDPLHGVYMATFSSSVDLHPHDPLHGICH